MDHVATARRFYEAINADDFVEHEQAPGLEPNKEGVKAFFRMYLDAFPDLRMEPEDILQDGDKVAIRARVTGTHKGDFMGIPPTGKSIDFQIVDIVRFGDDGRGHEHWGVSDALTMMQQLGVVPEGAPA